MSTKYIALLNKQGKQLRFVNTLDERSVRTDQSKVPQNITFIKERSLTQKELSKIGLVTDGLEPIELNVFDEQPDYDKFVEEEPANEVMATLLMATGFCAQKLKRNWRGPGSLQAVKERMDFLFSEMNRHQKLLSIFRSLDQFREDFFTESEEFKAMLQEVKRSAKVLLAISMDLQNLMGQKVDLNV